MAETFTWRPRVQSEGGSNFRVLSVQFGDGYKQSVGDGINTKVQSIKLSFIGNAAFINAIKAFLDARKGYEPFWFTKKGDATPLLWECLSYSDSYVGANVYTLNTQFTQRFDDVD